MAVYKKVITGLMSKGKVPTYINVTEEVRKIVEESGIQNGIVTVMSPHTTCSVFFEEYDHDEMPDGTTFLQQDLDNALAKIIPDQTAWGQYFYPGVKHFEAVESWPDIDKYLPGGDRTALYNCDAHLRSTIIGASQTFEVDNGKLLMSVTGYIYFVDFDRSRPRERKCRVVVIGE
ncbi:MAG: YjbQ family protein [Erysipelotrichaceae bacterium]|nr:YjbQ family protein [Erysipelotrichaceae bacterium]